MVVNALGVSELDFVELKMSVSSFQVAVALWCISYQLMPLYVD